MVTDQLSSAYEIAGILGIDPSPFTLRELVWMVTGHQKTAWVHTTHLLVTLANQNRGKDDQRIRFEDVYPFAEKKKQKLTPEEQAASDELNKLLFRSQFEKLASQQNRRGGI